MSLGNRIALLILACSAVVAHAAEEIRVPFNFQWGEAAHRLEDSLNRVQARIVERKMIDSRAVLVVEGIPQKLLLRALFYFEGDSLNEIELQYGDRSWDSAQYDQFFEQTRRNVDAKYGTGRVIARQKSNVGDLMQTLIGYQWAQSNTSLQLFYFTAEQGASVLRVISLHYKGT